MGPFSSAFALFAVWLDIFIFFDHLASITFGRGQFRARPDREAGPPACEVFGTVVYKRPNQLPRAGFWASGRAT